MSHIFHFQTLYDWISTIGVHIFSEVQSSKTYLIEHALHLQRIAYFIEKEVRGGRNDKWTGKV